MRVDSCIFRLSVDGLVKCGLSLYTCDDACNESVNYAFIYIPLDSN